MKRNVKLMGISRKGKNRVLEVASANKGWDGSWAVIDTVDKVFFSPENGPWLFVIPNTTQSTRFSRWVRAKNDVDFEVVPLTN